MWQRGQGFEESGLRRVAHVVHVGGGVGAGSCDEEGSWGACGSADEAGLDSVCPVDAVVPTKLTFINVQSELYGRRSRTVKLPEQVSDCPPSVLGRTASSESAFGF